MTRTDLAELREAAEKATPGEWVPYVSPHYNDGSITSGIKTPNGLPIYTSNNRYFGSYPGAVENQDFICLARRHILPLIERCEKAERAIADEIQRLENYNRGSHWEGCEEVHRECAAIKGLRAALEGT